MKDKCKLCEEEIEGLGNNPYPLLTDEGSRVCDTCDNFVTTVRIFDIQQTKREQEIKDEREANNG